jgi:hypothetical protein
MLKTHKLMQEKVRDRINQLEKEPCVQQPLCYFPIDSVQAALQVSIKDRLDELYDLLGETRPEHPFDVGVIPPGFFRKTHD